jgi:hypothetical protein
MSGQAMPSVAGVTPQHDAQEGRRDTPIAVGGYAGKAFQCPSEMISTVPSVTLMAVWSSMA